ncbi:DNA-3-methyladenine glycosylase [Mammaliicoccus fleurettii]|uniref:Putative 3-methyladenine DNA glycosylase n=1 Tax=Staphylococcus schleiferi TaxID=1295 RepID=A0ABX0G1S6_STASC|nr:DNA-3-methyladenine glycosylase [Staphylococcus schleiferi]NHA34739.1 3-methyladenine DNA glycosylase [Staphylococcus schleiferi]QGS46126.1 DNA-3-methyladenine glycosylase [Mammaliicoccus fleurettii]
MDFIHRPTIQTAQDLLGVQLIYESEHHTLTGYIVETEAYLGHQDQAAHGFQGKRTPKVESLYQEGGTIYAHTMHRQLLINFVTQTAGVPEGVLIRAIQPEQGIDIMEYNRGKKGYELTNGPGKLTQALQIPRAIDGSKLNIGRLKIDTKHRKYPRAIVAGPRIGIPNKGQWTDEPLRFTVKGNPYVSHMRAKDWLPAHETWKSS